MPKVYGVLILNKVFKKRWPYIHHVDEEKLFYQMRERCMVSTISFFSLYNNHRFDLDSINKIEITNCSCENPHYVCLFTDRPTIQSFVWTITLSTQYNQQLTIHAAISISTKHYAKRFILFTGSVFLSNINKINQQTENNRLTSFCSRSSSLSLSSRLSRNFCILTNKK